MRNQPQPVAERLEGRTLLSTIDFNGWYLHVTGSAGADTIELSVSGDTTTVRVNDTVRTFDSASVGKIRVDGADGDDHVTIGDGIGSHLEEILEVHGGTGDDVLIGSNFPVEEIYGGPGNDRIDGRGGMDEMHGGDGIDTVDYSSRTSSVVVNVGETNGSGSGGEEDTVEMDIERVLGGSGDDWLYDESTSAPNVFIGNGGNDRLDAGGGRDALFGGPGDDVMGASDINTFDDPGYAPDYYDGGSGTDTITYGRVNTDHVYDVSVSLDGVANDGRLLEDGQPENDNVVATEIVYGGAGDDILRGGSRDDRLFGLGGNDTLYGMGGDDTLDGGPGDDTLEGGPGDDRLSGGDGDDVLRDTEGSNTLDGGPGTDTINGVREPAGTPFVLQAEQAALWGARRLSTHAGYTGSGYADFTNASGDFIAWPHFSTGAAGDYVLTFRYANGSTSPRPLELLVNNRVVRSALRFHSTGGWDAWRTVSVTVPLSASFNGVRLTTIGFNGANIDSLRVAPAAPEPQVFQAEDAALFGADRASSNGGYTGSGYVDYGASAGEWVEFVIEAAQAGTRTIRFRYANGASSDRPLELRVNGSVVLGSMPFAPTGSWATWREVSTLVQFVAGTNRIRLTSIGTGPNIDAMTLV